MLRIYLIALIWFAGTIKTIPVYSEVIKVLTYGSMTGPSSMGELIEKEFGASCSGCAVTFLTTHETSGLLGRLRTDQRRSSESHRTVDVVMGLGSEGYKSALEENLILPGAIFQRSPFAFIADTERLPPSLWPKNWAEVPNKLLQKVLVQDPRISGTGIGWLRVIFDLKWMSPLNSKKVVSKVFPSWSASYEAFLAGHSPVVWSYLTSEAYHRCQTKPTERYRAIPLSEGYPQQQEWIALTKRTRNLQSAQRLIQFVLSSKVQQNIASKNWMYPVDKSVPLPECFSKVTPLTIAPEHDQVSAKELNRWIDEWSL